MEGAQGFEGARIEVRQSLKNVNYHYDDQPYTAGS
jgi:hypothetical protein